CANRIEVDESARLGLSACCRSPRRLQVLSLRLIALSFGLMLICGCADISSISPSFSLSRLTKNLPSLPHFAPVSPTNLSPEQLKTITPVAIVAGPDGNLWFSVLGSSAIGRITPAAEISLFNLGRGALADRLTAGPDDAIWFTDPAGNRIGRL